ncbi:MAG: hypothetical protein HN350_20475 [Phycisphaerales bacterium]|jgi:hypothetical protein|nr:hypothetical protein [Phycisphaerales bacterium]
MKSCAHERDGYTFGDNKMKTQTVLLTLIALFAVGCTSAQDANQTVEQIVLFDVHGMYGGQNLWIAADGKAVCCFVGEGESSLQETRYEFMVSADNLASLLELIKKHNFFSMRMKERYGIPDEASSNIFIKSDVETHAVMKWGNDTHRDFDAIYQFLLQIAESGKKGKQTHRGPFDWDWKPDGFPENKTIWDMTRPR